MHGWRHEHGDEFRVPVIIEATLPDCSWRNDVCPSFGYSCDDWDEDYRLWVNHPEPEFREFSTQERFVVLHGSNEIINTGCVSLAMRAFFDHCPERYRHELPQRV